MFDVTQKATEMIKESLKDQKTISSIRVVYHAGRVIGALRWVWFWMNQVKMTRFLRKKVSPLSSVGSSLSG